MESEIAKTQKPEYLQQPLFQKTQVEQDGYPNEIIEDLRK